MDSATADGESAAPMNPSSPINRALGHLAGGPHPIAVTFSVSTVGHVAPDLAVRCDPTQDPLARLSVVNSAGSSADLDRVPRSAVTNDVAGAMQRLADVRDRLTAAQGDIAAAEATFRRGLAEIERLPMPFERALLELAYGQVLRRAGQRRAAASQLRAARDRLTTLNARPYLERCDRELAACGLTPAKRSDFDPSRLTAQESAVARLVAAGMGNRQVANELFVSIKTVQFHLTHIYAEFRISSRGELTAQFRDHDSGAAG